MQKPSTEYHFKRKDDLEKYEGEQTRLVSILKRDHSEGVKSSLPSFVEPEREPLISREEFIRRLNDEDERNSIIGQKQIDDY